MSKREERLQASLERIRIQKQICEMVMIQGIAVSDVIREFGIRKTRLCPLRTAQWLLYVTTQVRISTLCPWTASAVRASPKCGPCVSQMRSMRLPSAVRRQKASLGALRWQCDAIGLWFTIRHEYFFSYPELAFWCLCIGSQNGQSYGLRTLESQS